jgi:SAM-dependent methyltransferase
MMESWEEFWNGIDKNDLNGQVFWDSVPEKAALEDIHRFKDYFDLDLPLLDLGCGNGRQSRFLARHFRRVIGIDISPSAIQLAKEMSADSYNIDFRVLDLVNTGEVESLHEEFGDMNIYMRGVLHMIKKRDRSNFIRGLELVLGERGTLYQIELPSKAILYLRELPQELFAQIPKITRRIGFNLDERESYYPDSFWDVLDQGDEVHIRTVPFENGTEGAVPANYLVLRRKKIGIGTE